MSNEVNEMSVYDKIRCTRKAGRATAVDYIGGIFTDFTELHGDRRFGYDHAIVAGIAKLDGKPVTVIGIEKGHDLTERMYRDFGCVLPEGYRKALRLMKEAEKFHRPVVCFVDTQGASCGKGAEERGEGAAIAENLYEISGLRTPVITVMIGEGGSGGALALAVADEVWMLENAYYSVVSPEACASILFKDASRADEAAEHLKLTANDLYGFGIVEKIIPEPKDFRDADGVAKMMKHLSRELSAKLHSLAKLDDEALLAARYEKYRKIGRYEEIAAAPTERHRFFRHG